MASGVNTNHATKENEPINVTDLSLLLLAINSRSQNDIKENINIEENQHENDADTFVNITEI